MWNLFTYAQPCDAAGTDFLGGGVCRPIENKFCSTFSLAFLDVAPRPRSKKKTAPPPRYLTPPPHPERKYENPSLRCSTSTNTNDKALLILISYFAAFIILLGAHSLRYINLYTYVIYTDLLLLNQHYMINTTHKVQTPFYKINL
jgi:hypothetical protein